MSEWRLLKSETFVLQRAKALEFAAKHAGLPHSPVEREVEQGRVKKLANVLRSGKALPFNWATVEFDGKIVRMNGQHSSTAIGEVGGEIPEKLTFHMDHYRADTRNGMVELFRQFDQRWSSRSPLDISGAYQGLTPELVDCNRKIMKAAAEGVSWAERKVEGIPSKVGDDTYDLLMEEKHTAFFKWVNGITNGRKELMKVEIMAAMYMTHSKSQSGATKFWREVSFGPDYFTDDMMPGAVLIGELSKALEDKAYREKEFSFDSAYYRKAIKAWGAFCAGQRIASLKVTKGKVLPDVSYFEEREEAA